MSLEQSERREFQRLRLDRPVVGRFGASNILILNIGVGGALLEHHALIEVGEKRRLLFQWNEKAIVLEAEVVRSTVERFAGSGEKKTPVYNSGIRFVEAIGESDQLLRQMIGFYLTRALEIQKANARGQAFDESAFPDQANSRLMGIRADGSRGYITCRLDGGRWQRTPTLRSVQPANGFTVSATEQDIDLLCSSYEEANDEGRNLIRMLAELSVSETRQIPPRRFEP
jgi:hypothetical protein